MRCLKNTHLASSYWCFQCIALMSITCSSRTYLRWKRNIKSAQSKNKGDCNIWPVHRISQTFLKISEIKWVFYIYSDIFHSQLNILFTNIQFVLNIDILVGGTRQPRETKETTSVSYWTMPQICVSSTPTKVSCG